MGTGREGYEAEEWFVQVFGAELPLPHLHPLPDTGQGSLGFLTEQRTWGCADSPRQVASVRGGPAGHGLAALRRRAPSGGGRQSRIGERPHRYLSMAQRAAAGGPGGPFSAGAHSARQGSKGGGCGANLELKPGCFLLPAGQCVLSYFTFLTSGHSPIKQGQYYVLLRDVVRFECLCMGWN